MFGDKRFEAKNADLKGTILLWLIVAGIPLFLLIHGMYNAYRGNIVFGIVELICGCLITGFWIVQITKSKKKEKVILGIIENGVCQKCTILEYSKEKDEMDFHECVVVESKGKVYIFGVNSVSVPESFPLGSTNNMYIRKRGSHEDILITNCEVNELHTTIDNRLTVAPHIWDKYAKKYNIS